MNVFRPRVSKIIISLGKFVAIMSLILAFTINIKAQESAIYWINEDFSTFEIQSAWVTTEANYPTAPNNVEITTYYAINIMGQSLINQKLTEENVQKIDVKNLPIGVYVIHISNNLGEISSYKLIKQ